MTDPVAAIDRVVMQFIAVVFVSAVLVGLSIYVVVDPPSQRAKERAAVATAEQACRAHGGIWITRYYATGETKEFECRHGGR